MEFFYKAHGKVYGPVSSSDLLLLARMAVVKPDTLLRAGVDGVWVRAGHYRRFFESVKGFPPPRTPKSHKPILSQAATMTVAKAWHVRDIVAAALQDTTHRHRQVSALEGYNLVQICTAFQLLVAAEFLLLTGRDDFEEKFAEGVVLYGGAPGAIALNFVPDDQADVALLPERAFDFLDPRILSQETPSSVADYCRSIGADDPLYWQKVYTRLGLEYTATSPRGNCPVPPPSSAPPTIPWRARRWPLTLRQVSASLLAVAGVAGSVLTLLPEVTWPLMWWLALVAVVVVAIVAIARQDDG